MNNKAIHLSITIVLLCIFANPLYKGVLVTIKGSPNTTIDNFDCSSDKYAEGGTYAAEVEYGLNELAYMTIDETAMRKTINGRYAWGSAYCQPVLSTNPTDCIVCLEAAADFLRDDCELSISAVVIMIDCGMSYGPI